MPPIILFMIAWIVAILAGIIYSIIQKNRLMFMRSQRIDNLYVVELPHGVNFLDLPFEKGIVLFAKKGRVLSESMKELDKIEESGNKRSVQALSFYFQDGYRINETIEEYTLFLIDEISKDRAKKHGAIAEADRTFYVKEQLKDKM